MKIVVEGASKLDGSYGMVNVHLAAALGRAGLDVSIAPWDQSTGECRAALSQAGLPGADELRVAGVDEPADVRIRQIWPPVWNRPPDGARLIVIQPWEYGSVPVEWLNGIAAADAVWVPTAHVKKGYVQSGVDPGKVWVVPNGTDLDVAWEDIAGRPRQRPLSLLFVGGGIHRKGIDVLISSLDGLADDVLAGLRLTVKESGRDSYYSGQSLVDEWLERCPRVAARTEVVRDHLSRADLIGLLRRADVLVHPYRAEGFGLPVLEAMACGVPVLVTAGGAVGDFCGPGEGHFVDSAPEVAGSPYVGDLLTVDYPYVLSPNADQLRERIRAMVTGELDPASTAEAAWRRARGFLWDAVARTAATAIGSLLAGGSAGDDYSEAAAAVARLVGDPAGPDWVEATRRLIALGDVHGALRAVRVARRAQGPDSRIVSTLRQLGQSATGPDLWSAADWRLDLARAATDDREVPEVVHQHEGSRPDVARIAQAILPYFSGCRKVLDIGCGQGAMMRALRATGREVVGIEGDPVLADELCGEGFRVVNGWIPDDLDRFDGEKFDGVFLGHIIEHLPTDTALAVLGWVSRHLEDGGILVIQTPNFEVDSVAKSNFWLDPTHIRPYPVQLLAAMLEGAGFAPQAGGCRSLAPHAPLDVIAVGRLRVPATPAPAAGAARVAAGAARRRKLLLHFGLFDSNAGMAHASRTLLDVGVLDRAGIDLVRVDVTGRSPASSEVAVCAPADAMELAADAAVVDVPVGWLPDVLPGVRARRRVVRLAYEATPVPAYITDALTGVDDVWAMSSFVVDACTAAGIPAGKVVHLPPVVDLGAAQRLTSAVARPERPEGSAVYSSIFNFEPRKNPDALVKAFAAVVDGGHDVGMIAKVGGIDEAAFWVWAASVLDPATVDRIRPRMSILTGDLTDDQIRALVFGTDAFVLPTRGEGFGLPFLEAMSLGVPSVCPDTGGHRDFCDAETSYLVETVPAPCLATWGIPLFRGSTWREVEPASLVAAMVEVATDRPRLIQKGLMSAKRAETFMAADRHAVVAGRLAALLDS